MAMPSIIATDFGPTQVTIPAVTSAGDRLLLFVTHENQSAVQPTVTNGTWSLVGSQAAVDTILFAYERAATGSDDNTTVSWSSSTSGSMWGVLVVVQGSNGVGASAWSVKGTAAQAESRSTPALSSTSANTLHLAVFTFDGSTAITVDAWDVTSAGWTEYADHWQQVGTRWMATLIMYIETPTSGTSRTASAAPDAEQNLGQESSQGIFTLTEAPNTNATAKGQYGWGTYGAGNYGADFGETPSDTTAPTVTLGTITKTKISRVAGADSTDIQFTVNENFNAYQVRLVPGTGSPVTAGTLIESGTTGTANVTVNITITDDELVAAGGVSGANIIKVFAQDAAGNWSTV